MTVLANAVRRSGTNPTTKKDAWLSGFSGIWTANGKVNDAAALSQTPFWRGMNVISGTVASMPMHVYQAEVARDGTVGRKKTIQTPDTAYLWSRPNVEMTQIDMWQRVIADIVRGNGYIWVDKDDDGGVAPVGDTGGIWWMNRTRVRTGRASNGWKVYEVDGELPMVDYKRGGEIVHFPNWGDGITGYDPVVIGSKALSLGLSAEEYANQFFAGGGVPSGVLTSEQILTQQQADQVLERWLARIKSNRPAVLGAGVKYQQTALDAEKSQMLQMRQFQVQEVARLLGIPPAKLADVDHASQGGANGVEEMNHQFYTDTLQALITRLEQGVSDALLVRELTHRYIKLNTGIFLRGNTEKRMQSYAIDPVHTRNEMRGLEDLEPVEGGDVLLAMTNLLPIDKLGEQAVPSGAP